MPRSIDAQKCETQRAEAIATIRQLIASLDEEIVTLETALRDYDQTVLSLNQQATS